MNPLDARRRILGRNVYKRTTEGNPAIAQGCLARRYPGLTMQGWTEQEQYEGNQLLDKIGIELSNVPQYIPVNVGDGDFTLSTDYVGTAGQQDIFFLAGNVESGAQSNTNGVKSGAPRTVTSVDGYVTVAIRKQNDDDLNPENYQIMLNSGSTALPYEPYTGGQPSPNPDYPQEITSAGKYDEASRKYQYTIKISDSEESPTKSQTVTLTSDRPLTKWDRLEKRDGVWGWVYKSAEVVLDGSEDEAWSNYPNFNGFLCSGVLDAIYSRSAGMCNQGAVNQDGSIGIPNTIWLGGNTNTVYFINNSYYNSDLEDEGLQNLKNHLAQSPAIIWYETAEETFVPLSESEQEALNALHTFRPTTVLSNDCECEMSLTYKTKKSLEVAT